MPLTELQLWLQLKGTADIYETTVEFSYFSEAPGAQDETTGLWLKFIKPPPHFTMHFPVFLKAGLLHYLHLNNHFKYVTP